MMTSDDRGFPTQLIEDRELDFTNSPGTLCCIKLFRTGWTRFKFQNSICPRLDVFQSDMNTWQFPAIQASHEAIR